MWHILSIGRDPLLLETRRMLLEASGCSVLVAHNLDEAAAACAREHFDAVVLCHTLKPEEVKAAYQRLGECVAPPHIVRLQLYEGVGYDPMAFIQRVQQVASSIPGAT
jgi:DNA-binding response OmpR family regulator